MANGRRGGFEDVTGVDEPEYDEATLDDLVQVLQRRKWVLFVVLILVVAGGVAFTVITPPQYESRATIVPLEHGDIITIWLGSRHAGELVVDAMGDRAMAALFPDDWNFAAGTWLGAPKTREQAGTEMTRHVTLSERRGGAAAQDEERYLQLIVRFGDPVLARDVGVEFIRTLNILRPDLENITRQEAFDTYYDGQNEQDAQRQAEVTARQKAYWLVVDGSSLPESPSSPNVLLNISLSVVLALGLGVFAAFGAEWFARYRVSRAELRVAQEKSK